MSKYHHSLRGEKIILHRACDDGWMDGWMEGQYLPVHPYLAVFTQGGKKATIKATLDFVCIQGD
jgi:hypothetical protein